MGRNQKTKNRMKKRVEEINKNFEDYWKHYDNNSIFSGPSTYFHDKTISLLKDEGLRNIFNNDQFFEYLYATLASWGLHRMGDTDTKLCDFEKFKQSIKSQKEDILTLKDKKITELKSDSEIDEVISDLQSIIDNIKIGVGKTKVIYNTKMLHHLLPELLPPIDRQYTLKFFYDNKRLANIEDTFKETYPEFVEIASKNKKFIRDKIGNDFNTSKTKVIDNAIVGYVKKEGLKD